MVLPDRERGSVVSAPPDTRLTLAEPRSFAPVNVDPIDTRNPKLTDLARGFNQLHACHEDTKAMVVEMRDALGITAGKKLVAGLSTPRKAFVRTVGATVTAIGGSILIYRLAVAVAPSAWAFLVNLNHAILSGNF